MSTTKRPTTKRPTTKRPASNRPTSNRPATDPPPIGPAPAAQTAGASSTLVLLVLSAARGVLGAAAFIAPVTASVLLGVDRGSAARMTWATRAFAGRDFAVGLLGVGGARQSGAGVRPALLTGAVCDAGDALTFLLAVRSRQIGRGRGALLILSSAGAATLGLVASQQAADR